MSVPLVFPTKPEYEVADVSRLYGEEYRRKHSLSLEQLKTMSAIESCRTAALGGHVDRCDRCGALRISYNSCRNRHYPKCGALARERWLTRQQEDLLPIEYFHLVFTIDHGLNRLASFNERAIYDLLFHSAAETLKEFGERYLGGEIGITAILHTWGQNLSQHIHLHCIVTGGALSADGKKWQPAQGGFLFPVVELSAAFRDRFCEGMKRLYARGKLQIPEEMEELRGYSEFGSWMDGMKARKWQVYVKESWGHPEEVLAYFGRYAHRVAISNSRIVSIEGGKVRFTWKDYRDGGKEKVMTLVRRSSSGGFSNTCYPVVSCGFGITGFCMG